jgi:heparin binding hemagglutinin HbhA
MTTKTKPAPKFSVAEAVRPLYASVGAAEAAVETVTTFVKKQYAGVTEGAKTVETEAKSLRDQAVAKYSEGVTTASNIYSDFAKRGEQVIAKIRKSEPVAKAGEQVAKAGEQVAKATEPVSKAVSEAVEVVLPKTKAETTAETPVAEPSAAKAPAAKTATKKAPVKKPAAAKAVAKKPVAEKVVSSGAEAAK